jgi:hypothetical protein
VSRAYHHDGSDVADSLASGKIRYAEEHRSEAMRSIARLRTSGGRIGGGLADPALRPFQCQPVLEWFDDRHPHSHTAPATPGATAELPRHERALLAAGADVNAEAAGGFTALVEASQGNYPEVVRALLAAGADVNAKAAIGTALTIASQRGSLGGAGLAGRGGRCER